MLKNITQQQLVEFLIKKQQEFQNEIFHLTSKINIMANYEKKANSKAKTYIEQIHPSLEPVIQEYIKTGKTPDFEYKKYSIKKIQKSENHDDFFTAAILLSKYIDNPESGENEILKTLPEIIHAPPCFANKTSEECKQHHKKYIGEKSLEQLRAKYPNEDW
jgi:hypothetical protein